jgi:predicted enzyme related to lactoylglutathione lyase
MERKVLWPVLVIGLALVIAPFALGMPGKTAAGQRMLNDFHPLMQAASVQKTADYYDNVFTKLRPVALAMNDQTVAKFQQYGAGFQGMMTDGQKLVPALAQAMHMTNAQVQTMMATQFPHMAALLAALPTMSQDFSQLIGLMSQNTKVFARVPGGLDWYKPLVTTMQGNVNDYASVDSLPNFNLFTWFFVIPGALLALLAGYGLWHEHELTVHRAHPTPA